MGKGFQHRTTPAGFTLIELVVVLALIAILTAVILPEMRGTFEETVLRSTARTLVSACNTAGSRAVATGTAHQLVIDAAANRYRIQPNRSAASPVARTSSGDSETRDSGPLDPRVVVEVRREESIGPDGAAHAVEFRPDGTADAAEFVLRDRAGFVIAIRVNPVTARPGLREVGRR